MKNSAFLVDSILHPEDAFPPYQKYLMELYLEDYGEEYYRLIQNRMNHTIYLFESTPIQKMEFLKKHVEEIHDYREVLKIEMEYHDYMAEKKKIEKKFLPKYYEKLAYYFGLSSRVMYPEILKLDYESFSFENQSQLKSSSIRDDIKQAILERREKYLESCHSYGVTPITDSCTIQYLLEFRNKLIQKEQSLLVQNTKWGKRIRKNLCKKTPFDLSNEDIAHVLYTPHTASTTIFSDGIRSLVICFFPVVRTCDIQEMDHSFFHENRHVIETGNQCCGIDNIFHSKYEVLNEIRTEKNAVRDSERLKYVPLFSNQELSSDCFNAYAGLFPYVSDFFEEHKEFIDDVSIRNDVSSFEGAFDKDTLMEFNRYLGGLEEQYITNHGIMETSKESAKEYVNRLNTFYRTRQ